MGWVLDEYLDEEFLLTAGAPPGLSRDAFGVLLDEEGLRTAGAPTGLITGCVRPWRASEHPLDKPAGAPACRKPFLVKAR